MRLCSVVGDFGPNVWPTDAVKSVALSGGSLERHRGPSGEPKCA